MLSCKLFVLFLVSLKQAKKNLSCTVMIRSFFNLTSEYLLWNAMSYIYNTIYYAMRLIYNVTYYTMQLIMF